MLLEKPVLTNELYAMYVKNIRCEKGLFIQIECINILWKTCISHSISFSESRVLDPRCDHILDQGTCRDYNIYWYYDKQANACAQFWYGGCGGNDNRYQTEDECKKTCVLFRTGNFCRFWTANVHVLFFIHIFLSCLQQDKTVWGSQKVDSTTLQSTVRYFNVMHCVCWVQKIISCTFWKLTQMHLL